MNMNCISYTVPGRRHISIGRPNEDVVDVRESERILVLAVADGCSGSSCARPAAEATVAACMEFAMNENIWEMKPKAIREACIHMLDKHYLNCPYPYGQLAATMAVLIINKVTEHYIAMSIGDCSCVVLTSKLDPALLLEPVNLLRQRNQTVFANSSSASRHMKMEYGTMDGIGGFMLLTDGADRLLDQDRVVDIQQLTSLTILAPKQAQTALEDYVKRISNNTSDDITIAIAMRADDEQLTDLAGATCHTKPIPDDEQVQVQPDFSAEEEPVVSEPDKEESLLEFLKQPRTAEEIVIAGYVNAETTILTELYPYLKAGLIRYHDHMFDCT